MIPTFADLVMPVELRALTMSADVPVIVVTAVAPTAVVVLASMAFKSVAVAEPGSIVTPTLADLVMTAVLRAIAICAAVPVIRFAEVATILPVVIA